MEFGFEAKKVGTDLTDEVIFYFDALKDTTVEAIDLKVTHSLEFSSKRKKSSEPETTKIRLVGPPVTNEGETPPAFDAEGKMNVPYKLQKGEKSLIFKL
ncbi:unnamed protein product [Dibothriocephalus latus]|uniref:Uncharacterized protein n=1 Tax=Dibothriocephalus latus TaxID=60516 RepID=A0A3P7NIT7_DIBLA|nr:unnamed protein product [Dibothriocephalus latus]